MNIIVCDDEKKELDNTSKLISDYSKKNNIKVNIRKYIGSNELVSNLKYIKNNEVDVIFLDIIMKQNGIELAELIRQMNIKAPIIFTTTSKEYALDAFKVHAFDYLVKPLDRENMSLCLNRLIEHLNIKAKSTFSVKNDVLDFVTIDINEIMYIESNERRILYHMTNNEVVRSVSIRTKFSTSIPFDYNNYNFLNCHSAFIVNMNYIKGITEISFVMKNNDIIPISKKYFANVKKVYANYLLGE